MNTTLRRTARRRPTTTIPRISRVFHRQGKLTEAEDYVQQALEIFRKRLPENHRRLAEAQVFCAIEEESRLGALGVPIKVMVKGGRADSRPAPGRSGRPAWRRAEGDPALSPNGCGRDRAAVRWP